MNEFSRPQKASPAGGAAIRCQAFPFRVFRIFRGFNCGFQVPRTPGKRGEISRLQRNFSPLTSCGLFARSRRSGGGPAFRHGGPDHRPDHGLLDERARRRGEREVSRDGTGGASVRFSDRSRHGCKEATGPATDKKEDNYGPQIPQTPPPRERHPRFDGALGQGGRHEARDQHPARRDPDRGGGHLPQPQCCRLGHRAARLPMAQGRRAAPVRHQCHSRSIQRPAPPVRQLHRRRLQQRRHRHQRRRQCPDRPAPGHSHPTAPDPRPAIRSGRIPDHARCSSIQNTTPERTGHREPATTPGPRRP